MVDYSLIKNIAFGIKKYVEKQEILHLSFIRAHSDLVKLSNIEFLPRNGFVFDEEMNKWEFKKHGDRKSTRLNSSHTVISYAVFCLKKKKKNNDLEQFERNEQNSIMSYFHQ